MARKSGLQSLIEDAQAKGATIERKENGMVRISLKSAAITIHPNGVATRSDKGMDLSVCKAIRTFKEMRKALGLS